MKKLVCVNKKLVKAIKDSALPITLATTLHQAEHEVFATDGERFKRGPILAYPVGIYPSSYRAISVDQVDVQVVTRTFETTGLVQREVGLAA